MFEKIREEARAHRVYIITSNSSGGGMFLRTYGARTGIANISFVSPEELAGQIVSKNIIESSSKIVSSVTLHLMILGIIKNCRNKDSVFSEIKDSIGFPKGIQSFINTARYAGLTPEELAGLSKEYPASAQKWKELADIYKSYLDGLKDRNCLDEGDLLSMAAKELSEGVCGWLKSSKLYLMDDIRGYKLYRELFEVLKSNYGMEEITGDFIPVSGEGALRRLKDGIFSKEKTAGNIDGTARLLVSHDAKKEAQEIIRSFIFDAEGSFGENSLAVANYSENVKYISELLDMADIPAVFTGGLPIVTTRAGAAVLRFIKFLQEDRDYITFIKLLEEAPLDMAYILGEERIPIAPFSKAVSGHNQNPPLSPFNKGGSSSVRGRWRKVLQDVVLAGGTDEWLRLLKKGLKVRERDVESVKQLIKLLEKFKRDFSVIYVRKKAGDEIALREMVSALKKFPGEWLNGRNEKEAAVLKNICGALNELEKNAGDLSIKFNRGLKIIEEKVSSIMIGARQPDGKSLVVTPLRSAGWIYSKRKYFYGMDENSIPRKTARISFLPEEERAFLNEKYNCGISGREELIKEDKKSFRDAVLTAEDRITFSYSDIDPNAGKNLQPSSFLLEAFESITGLPATTEDLALSWAGVYLPEGNKQVSRGDFERNIISRGEKKGVSAKLMPIYPNLIAGYKTLQKRLDRKRFTDRDGLLAGAKLTVPCGLFSEDGVISNKMAEMYAGCPFKYFIRYLLKVKPTEIPEIDSNRWPDSMTRGSVYHDIYCCFLGELKKKGRLPLRESEANLNLLKNIADKAITELKEEYEPPNNYMEESFRAELKDNLREWYDMELADQKTWLPLYFELPLGKTDEPYEGISEEGLKAFLETGGTKYEVSGWIDRIDMDKERNIRITDYKTGKEKIKADDILKDGANLQLVFYAKALEPVLSKLGIKKHGKIFVRYYFSTATGGFRSAELEVSEAHLREFDRVTDIIRTQSEKGVFIPTPSKDSCNYCDFPRICGQLKEYIYKPKLRNCRDGAISDFMKIRDGVPDK